MKTKSLVLLVCATLMLAASAHAADREPVRFHARIGAGPSLGYTETYSSVAYTSEVRSASGEYALRYWGFGSNIEIGGGFNYRRVRFGVLVGLDMTPLQEVGPGAEGAGLDVDDHTTEREVYSVFAEHRLRRAPWLIGGSVGWTRLVVETCCLEGVPHLNTSNNVAATGPALTFWVGQEWRWGEHWAGHALLRMSGMTSDLQVLEAVFGGQDRTTVSLVTGIMLGVALH